MCLALTFGEGGVSSFFIGGGGIPPVWPAQGEGVGPLQEKYGWGGGAPVPHFIKLNRPWFVQSHKWDFAWNYDGRSHFKQTLFWVEGVVFGRKGGRG